MFDDIDFTEPVRGERSEYLGLLVTPEIKNKFEFAIDNKALQEKIIKDYLKSETSWLKTEMNEIDEQTIKYRAKLITIKENFSDAQSEYINEIETISNKAYDTFKKLDMITNTLNDKIMNSFENVKKLSNAVSHINYMQLDGLMDAIDRFDNMTTQQKELINLMIQTNK